MCQIDEGHVLRAGAIVRRWPLAVLTVVGGVAAVGLALPFGIIVDPPLGASARWVVASILLLLGGWEVAAGRAPLTFVGRETPRAWAEHRPARWALMTGATLGTGVLTRIGVALWFAVPLSALIARSTRDVMVVFAVYAVVRNGLTVAVSASYERHGARLVAEWLTARMAIARRISGYSCVAVAGAVLTHLL